VKIVWGEDRVDGQRALHVEPGGERECERRGEDRRRDRLVDAVVVGEVVGDQRSLDAHQHDGGPVDARDVAAGLELGEEESRQDRGHDQGSGLLPQVQVRAEEVRRRFAHRGGQHFDQPEIDGDFGNFVNQKAETPPCCLYVVQHERHDTEPVQLPVCVQARFYADS
jgi:hypothetical protein